MDKDASIFFLLFKGIYIKLPNIDISPNNSCSPPKTSKKIFTKGRNMACVILNELWGRGAGGGGEGTEQGKAEKTVEARWEKADLRRYFTRSSCCSMEQTQGLE